MLKRSTSLLIAAAMAMFGLLAGPLAAEGPKAPRIESTETYQGREIPEFNRIVLELIQEYPHDGTHDYNWPRGDEPQHDGVTTDLYFLGSRVMHADPDGRTYCCGLTLEAFLKAYEKWIAEHGEPPNAKLKPETWSRFQRLWFVLEVNGPGPSAALEEYGLGREIEKEEALPGDFVQIWRRQGSGHSVIFVDWARNEEGEITGFHYWSTQPRTKGISQDTEYFAPPEARRGVADEYTYWARVEIPKPAPVEEAGAAQPHQ